MPKDGGYYLFRINQPKDEGRYYYNFWLPFSLEPNQADESLMSGINIEIKPVDRVWVKQIAKQAAMDGWQTLNKEFYDDGGSVSYDYFLNKNEPAVSLFFRYDMSLGEYASLSIRYVHPSDIPGWLLDIQQHKEAVMQTFDAAKYVGCAGVLGRRTAGAKVECIQ